MKITALRSAQMSVADQPSGQLVPLPERTELIEVDGKIAKLRARIVVAQERKERAKHRRAGTKPASSPLQLAERLAEGLEVDSADPGAEIAAADEEILHLGRGINALLEQRAEILSRLAYEESLKFRPQHEAALRRLDAAIGEIHGALSTLSEINSALHAAGYIVNTSALPAQVPAAVFRLGDPDDSRFDAWRFRQWLQKTFGAAR